MWSMKPLMFKNFLFHGNKRALEQGIQSFNHRWWKGFVGKLPKVFQDSWPQRACAVNRQSLTTRSGRGQDDCAHKGEAPTWSSRIQRNLMLNESDGGARVAWRTWLMMPPIGLWAASLKLVGIKFPVWTWKVQRLRGRIYLFLLWREFWVQSNYW